MTEQPGDQPPALDAALPPVERLVNLTDHAITVESLTTSPHGKDGAPVPVTATFAPAGRVANPAPVAAAQTPQYHAKELIAHMTVTIETLRENGESAIWQPRPNVAAFPSARPLLVRIVQEQIGRIALDLAAMPGIIVHAPGCLTDSVLCPRSDQVPVAERQSASAGQAEQHPGHGRHLVPTEHP